MFSPRAFSLPGAADPGGISDCGENRDLQSLRTQFTNGFLCLPITKEPTGPMGKMYHKSPYWWFLSGKEESDLLLHWVVSGEVYPQNTESAPVLSVSPGVTEEPGTLMRRSRPYCMRLPNNGQGNSTGSEKPESCSWCITRAEEQKVM